MKTFIFLYPDKEHINWAIEQNSSWMQADNKEKYLEKCSFINRVIDRRYGCKDYSVNWLLFCVEGNRQLPELSSVSGLINIMNSDKIINAGISRKEHVEKKVYPDEEFIFSQLGNVNRLRVGGFLSADCCRRIAKYAYEKGIEDTLIDEDLTEQFFLGVRHSLIGVRLKIGERRKFIQKAMPIETYNSLRNVPWLIKY